MNRSELLALVDSTLVGSLYIVRVLSVAWWICLDAVVCANPDVVQALMPLSKRYQTRVRNPGEQGSEVSGQRSDLAQCQKGSKWSTSGAPVFAEATARQGNQLRFGPACARKKPQMIPQPREYRTL